MVLARAEKMIFQPPEVRQHVVIAPAGEAELAPMIVIGACPRIEIMALMADEPPITLPRDRPARGR